MVAALRRGDEAIGEVGEGFDRHPRYRGQAVFLETRHLAREAVEFAVAGQDARRPPRRQAGQEAADEVMGIGRESQSLGIIEREVARDAPLHLGNHLAEDMRPLAIGQPRRILPACQLSIEGHVGPVVMAVRGEVQALRHRLKKSTEVLLIADFAGHDSDASPAA